MPPSRRKGSGRGSTALPAARHQYKVGDLVLAKVKGFPAWPATVSEPEKWGYSRDWRKVLVYFFGTKQIGFCNPADVEAFTEEKKKTLLLKRQGKGADFVRAVDEIIDSFENSKKENRDEYNSGDEGTASNAGSLDSKLISSMDAAEKNELEISPSEAPYASIDKSDSCNAIDVTVPLVQIDESKDIEIKSEEATKVAAAHAQSKRTPKFMLCSSRKKSADTTLKSCILQRRPSSVRRSRSSSRSAPSKIPKIVLPSVDFISDPEAVPNVINDESMRNKLLQKSPDSSVSAAFVSNYSSEDVGSEIVALESEAASLKEGCIVESPCKIEHSGAGTDFIENDVEMNGMCEIHAASAVVIKKKRKPSKKRMANGMAHSKLEKEKCLESESSKYFPKSPEVFEKPNIRFHEVDGDEHLPLVKRARARMGKPSPLKKQVVDFVDMKEEPASEDIMNCSGKATSSFSHDDSSSSGRTLFELKAAIESSSPGKTDNHTRETNLLCRKADSYHLRGSSFDGEAALPPSKRLHRALEAMSANAAEAGLIEGIKTMGFPSNGCRSSEQLSFFYAAINNRESLSHSSNSFCQTASETPMRSIPLKYEQIVKTSTIENPIDINEENDSCPRHVICKELSREVNNDTDVKDLADSSGNTVTPEILVPSNLQCHALDINEGGMKSGQTSIDKILPANKEIEMDVKSARPCSDGTFEVKVSSSLVDKPNFEQRCSLFDPNGPCLDAEARDAVVISPKNVAVLLSSPSGCSVANDICQGVKTLSSGENVNDKKKYGAAKEADDNLTSKDGDVSSDLTSMKFLIAAAQAKRHFFRSFLSDHHSENRISGDMGASPHLNHASDLEKMYPPNSSDFQLSTSDDGGHPMQNGTRSTGADRCQKNDLHAFNNVYHEGRINTLSTHREKNSAKWSDNAEANAAWRSFRNVLGTLSRTKESIGRATRLAIDCAKYGIIEEVVELLLQHLENEPSLHRRVDLFFLVDSITQCSRGQKGSVGDIYSSAVQAVLPRLLSAAAPPGSSARENRRQCLKVLRVWLERKTLPESVVRRHLQELESLNDTSFISAIARCPSKTERALNDPIREMEGMLVDEYGSNTGFQLSGFLMPRMLDDEENECSSDEKSFEAVTPEQDRRSPDDPGTSTAAAKHPHILEDVDGELEMEDVAPSHEDEMNSGYAVGMDNVHNSHHQFDQQHSLPFAPPLPQEMPPSPPPLPSSPPPMAPPLTSPAMYHPFSDAPPSQHYLCRPSMLKPQSMDLQPSTANVGSTPLDTRPHHPSGHMDHPIQMLAPVSSFNSGSCGALPGSNPSSNDVQKPSCSSLSKKGHHLQPPLPTISNQFSYVQADTQQRTESWMDCSSSPHAKRSHYVYENPKENFFSHQARTSVSQHEADARFGYSTPVHSGTVHASKSDSYPISYLNSLEHKGNSSNGRPLPPTSSNYRHSVPIFRSPLENQRASDAAPTFWRSR